MESLGKKLQEERCAKGLELEYIARETNITRRYLEALESERFDEFPGESYLLGFLRNYCDYLGLDADEFVSLYKNQKIQEINIPISELLPTRPFYERIFSEGVLKIIIAVIAVVLVVGLGVGGYKLLRRLPRAERTEVQVVARSVPVVREAAVHEMDSSQFSGRVFVGDTIMVPIEGTVFSVAVQETSPTVKLETNGAVRIVELGQEISFDVSDDGRADIKVFVSDLDANNPDAGAEITLETGPFTQSEEFEDSADTLIVLTDSETTDLSSSGQIVLFESASAYPVTLNATFRGICLFRYEIDRRERDERLYQRSETLVVQARDGLRIWASNGNAVRLQIIAGGRTVDLELSRPGEVIVKDLRWYRDNATGRYRFAAVDVE